MALTHKNRLKTAVSAVASSGLGAFTIGAAASGYRTFGASDDGNTFDVLILEGTAWEVRRDCAYTHSSTSLARGTLEDSSTGSAIAFTSAAVIAETLTAYRATQMQALVAPGPARPIFAARLQTTVTPEMPSTGVTTTFTRQFDQAIPSSTEGIYGTVGHNTAGFGYVRLAGRAMLQGATQASSILISGGTEHRDFTVAGWVKTNCAAAKTSTGIDNAANGCSSLTATADAATALYTTTGGATSRTFQAWIRRKAGLGRVWITADNGTNWTDVTAQIGKPGGIYRRVDVQTSAANPVCGFRLEYNADAIDVDAASCVASAYAIGPLVARGYSVEGMTLTYAGCKPATMAKAFAIAATMVSDGQGAIAVNLKPSSGSGQFTVSVSPSGNVPLVQMIAQSGTILYNNTPSYVVESAAIEPGVPVRVRALYAAGSVFAYINGRLTNVSDLQTPPTHDVTGFTDLTVAVPNNCQIADLAVEEWTGRVVVLVGDSITARLGYRRAWLGAMPDAAVLNKGVGGDTVAAVLARITADMTYALPPTSTCDVVLWIGTNSLAAGVSASAALTDLQSIVTAIKAINADARVTLISTITNRTSGFSGGMNASTFLTAAETYNAGLSSITGIRGVVELNGTDMGVDTSLSTFLEDGIHPYDWFYSRMVKKMAAQIL